jgi:hypothetical protein
MTRRDVDDLAALELEATGGYRDGDVVMRVDSRNIVSEEAWGYIVAHYWVLAYAHEEPYWFGWCFSVSEPMPVPNESMFWRRPTYAEAVRREQMFLDDPAGFRHCMDDYESNQGRYPHPRDAPPTRAAALAPEQLAQRRRVPRVRGGGRARVRQPPPPRAPVDDVPPVRGDLR